MIDADVLKLAMDEAVLQATRSASSIFITPANSRQYGCDVSDCTRPAYAGGMCNAHYMRKRAGKPLDVPVRARKRDDKCKECGEITGTKGGWGFCVGHYRKKRYAVIKGALVDAMGGCCSACKVSFPLAVYDFHHTGNKQESPGDMIASRSTEAIADELSNCVLLCANCHRMEHNK
jgi:hypothetical protein